MKWSERGPVAWPFVRRSRFLKELGQQRATFEKRIGSEQHRTQQAEFALAQERREHEADLRNMLDIKSVAMQRHDEYHMDRRVFTTVMSNTLIAQMVKTANPARVAEMVMRDVIGQMLTASREL